MIARLLSRARRLLELPSQLQDRLDAIQMTLGRVEGRQTMHLRADELRASEFQVFSQFGEDGIIQFLLRHVPVEKPIFVEFGVQDYRESNTRFLLQHANWMGLVLDGTQSNIDAIRADPIYWRYNLKSDCVFVTRDNINAVIARHGIKGDIGLLSIDIDGNDYWVWEAIDCVDPRIVVVEYNSLYGPHAKVSVPYRPDFFRTHAHHSNLYWGASLAALDLLAQRKGFMLVGSNSAGNNAFFVRRDLAGSLPGKRPAEAWVRAQFREARSATGQLTYEDPHEALRKMRDLPVVEVQSGKTVTLADIDW